VVSVGCCLCSQLCPHMYPTQNVVFSTHPYCDRAHKKRRGLLAPALPQEDFTLVVSLNPVIPSRPCPGCSRGGLFLSTTTMAAYTRYPWIWVYVCDACAAPAFDCRLHSVDGITPWRFMAKPWHLYIHHGRPWWLRLTDPKTSTWGNKLSTMMNHPCTHWSCIPRWCHRH
jgi:hypothetical protein